MILYRVHSVDFLHYITLHASRWTTELQAKLWTPVLAVNIAKKTGVVVTFLFFLLWLLLTCIKLPDTRMDYVNAFLS